MVIDEDDEGAEEAVEGAESPSPAASSKERRSTLPGVLGVRGEAAAAANPADVAAAEEEQGVAGADDDGGGAAAAAAAGLPRGCRGREGGTERRRKRRLSGDNDLRREQCPGHRIFAVDLRAPQTNEEREIKQSVVTTRTIPMSWFIYTKS